MDRIFGVPKKARRTRILAPIAVGLLLVAGCGSSSPGSSSVGSSAGENAQATTTLTNCGREVQVDAPPQRIVAVNTAAVENLLALGLQDRIVAVSGKRESLRPDLRETFDALTNLGDTSESYPSAEIILDNEPDFFYSAYRSAFEENGGVQSRDEFDALGVDTYLSPPACPERDKTLPLTFDEYWGELTDLGELLGVSDRAEALVSEQRTAIDEVRGSLPETEPLTAFWWDIGTNEPWGGLCCGAPGLIMRELGLVNVFEDREGDWNDVSWEQVVQRDPDVIIMADFGDGDIAEKRDFIANDTTLRLLRAFTDDRIIVLPFSQTTPGLQNVEAIRTIGDALRSWNAGG